MLFSKIRKTKIFYGNFITCSYKKKVCSFFKHEYNTENINFCKLYCKPIQYLDSVSECNQKYGLTYNGNP